MSSDIPDDWFRPEGAPRSVGGADGKTSAVGPQERYTDQFKPDYPSTHPGTAAPTTAGTAAEAPAAGPFPGRRRGQQSVTSGPSHSVGVAPPDEPPAAPRRHRQPLVRLLPAGLGLAALIGLGVVIGQLVGGHQDTTTTTDPQLSDAPIAASQPSASATAAPTPWIGAVQPVKATGVTASCTAPPQDGYDGRKVPSEAKRVLDGDLATGWRCDGDGQGQTLTFTFPAGTKVVGVRMTNGYTKSVDGTSLYPQYRRVTTATWSFPSLDNAFFLQNLADGNRALQEIRIPETTADGGMQLQVTMTSEPGSTDQTRNAVLLTEVQFLARKA